MFYFKREENNEPLKTGIYFYPLSDKNSAGFVFVKANRYLKYFRYSKNARDFIFKTVYMEKETPDWAK